MHLYLSSSGDRLKADDGTWLECDGGYTGCATCRTERLMRLSASYAAHLEAGHEESRVSEDGFTQIAECASCHAEGRAVARWKLSGSEIIPLQGWHA